MAAGYRRFPTVFRAARSRRCFRRLECQLRDVLKDALDLLADDCPIVESYGAKDLTLRGAPVHLAGALTSHGIDRDITVYPDAATPS